VCSACLHEIVLKFQGKKSKIKPILARLEHTKQSCAKLMIIKIYIKYYLTKNIYIDLLKNENFWAGRSLSELTSSSALLLTSNYMFFF
jgi:hypothetical protein